MPCKNSKCKHICMYCEHIVEDSETGFKCAANAEDRKDCVTGETFKFYPLCKDINSKGDCKKFKMDKEKQAIRGILKHLQKFDAQAYHGNRDDTYNSHEKIVELTRIQKMLLRNLIYELKGQSSEFEEIVIPDVDEYEEDHFILYKWDFRDYPETYNKWLKEKKDANKKGYCGT